MLNHLDVSSLEAAERARMTSEHDRTIINTTLHVDSFQRNPLLTGMSPCKRGSKNWSHSCSLFPLRTCLIIGGCMFAMTSLSYRLWRRLFVMQAARFLLWKCLFRLKVSFPQKETSPPPTFSRNTSLLCASHDFTLTCGMWLFAIICHECDCLNRIVTSRKRLAEITGNFDQQTQFRKSRLWNGC